jgi:hypothetical protein
MHGGRWVGGWVPTADAISRRPSCLQIRKELAAIATDIRRLFPGRNGPVLSFYRVYFDNFNLGSGVELATGLGRPYAT